MSLQWARGMVALAWTTPETSNIEMDTRLAEAFAEILERETNHPRLGLATTSNLIEEIIARIKPLLHEEQSESYMQARLLFRALEGFEPRPDTITDGSRKD